MNHLRGKFIVFDGGEGCGKSTQAQMLAATLQKADVPVILVRDPGSTRVGEMIREILLRPIRLQHPGLSTRRRRPDRR
jgi:dTMP kinase